MKLSSIVKSSVAIAGLWAQVGLADVVGEWYTDCTEMTEQGVTVYVTDYYAFNADGTYSQESAVYQDKKCNKLFILNTFEGSFLETANTSHADLNLTLEKHYFTFSALLAPLMPILNKEAMCGYKDWKVDAKKEVTGKVCELNILGQKQEFPTLMQTESIFSIVGIESGMLYMGEFTVDLDGSAEDKRPTDLNKTIGYTKL